MASLGAFNQVWWIGAGDADECWIVATYWALVATGVMTRDELPTIKQFRAAAGKPDKPGPTGGSNEDILKGIKALIPGADAKLFAGGITAFEAALKAGYVASLSVLSKNLPKYLQFGFSGAHQISVYYKGGKLYVMNPLAKEGSALIEISARDLVKAGSSLYKDRKLHAVLIKAKPPSKTVTKASAKAPEKKQPERPRDLNAPIIIRNYIDPYQRVHFYEARHRDTNILDGLD